MEKRVRAAALCWDATATNFRAVSVTAPVNRRVHPVFMWSTARMRVLEFALASARESRGARVTVTYVE